MAGNKQYVTLPIPPAGNHALMPIRFGKKARLSLTPEMRAWKRQARETVGRANLRCISGRVRLTFFVFNPNQRDSDCGIKQLIDSLTGSAFKDDRQVADYHVYPYRDQDNPRVDIIIEEK